MDDKQGLCLEGGSERHRDHGFAATCGDDDDTRTMFEGGLDGGFLVRAQGGVAMEFGGPVFCADRVGFPLEFDVVGLCDVAEQTPCAACDTQVAALKAVVGFALARCVMYSKPTGHLLFPCGVGKGEALGEIVIDPSKGRIRREFDLAIDVHGVREGCCFHRKSLHRVALEGVSAYARRVSTSVVRIKAYTSATRMQAMY